MKRKRVTSIPVVAIFRQSSELSKQIKFTLKYLGLTLNQVILADGVEKAKPLTEYHLGNSSLMIEIRSKTVGLKVFSRFSQFSLK